MSGAAHAQGGSPNADAPDLMAPDGQASAADNWRSYVETLANYADNPGWPPRIRRFIERPHGHCSGADDPDLRAQVIDMMVNPGIGAIGQMLLDILEERGHDVRINPTDNVIGSRALGTTRDLVNGKDEAELTRINNELVRRRKAYYAEQIRKDPRKNEYRGGWMDRADSFRFLPTGRQR